MRPILVFLLLLGQCQGQLLSSSLDKEFSPLTEAQRESMSSEFAKKALDERDAEFKGIRNALTSGSTNGVSLKLGAHHQLNQLSPSLSSFVDQAEFYNDYIHKYQNDLSSDDQTKILDYNSKEVTVAYPKTNKVPSYPDCGTICDASAKYRTFDGLCNNLENCVQGSKGKTFRRFIAAQYDDFDQPRSKGLKDPMWLAFNAFNITKGMKDRITSDRQLTQMMMNFGQFYSHDSIATPARTVFTTDGKPIQVDCNEIIDELTFEACARFGFRNREFSFIRSAAGIIDKDKTYRFGNREQINLQTSFIDGSHIYGTSKAEAEALYDASTGLLKTSHVSPVKTEQFPPTSADQYCEGKEGNDCFLSGDTRTNIQLGMQMLHTLFLREHNRIATEMKSKNDWDGKKIYEETRRIIGAFLQSISYNDFLPLIVGQTMAQRYGLNPKSGTTYDSDVDPTIFNEYATAAMRYGHSQIYNQIRMASPSGQLSNKAGLFSTFFSPDRFYNERNGYTVMRRYLMGLALEVCDAVDTTMSSTMSGTLFRSKNSTRESHLKRGIALAALNIQRGRDHGIPNCGAFMDHVSEMTGETIEKINDSEQRAKDLFLCGLEEKRLSDGELGPIFAHMVATQAKNSMIGDRFFYSHTNAPNAFTSDQRKEIEKVSLAQLICRFSTTNKAGRRPVELKLTKNVFLTPEVPENGLMDCEDILLGSPDLNTLF